MPRIAAPASVPVVFEIGTQLREARQRRGLDMPECERQTKIRAKYLRALEDEEFGVLPAPTYVRGFLRAYAEFLDLDGQLVIDEYESRFLAHEAGLEGDSPRRRRGSTPTHSRIPPPKSYRSEREPESRLLWLAAASMLAVSLIVYGFKGGEPTQTPTLNDATTDEGLVAQPPPAQRLRIVLTGLPPDGTELEVRGKNASGRPVYEGILPAGSSRSYPVATGLWIRVGRSDGLRVSVNGASAPLDGSSDTADYLVSKSGAKRLATGG